MFHNLSLRFCVSKKFQQKIIYLKKLIFIESSDNFAVKIFAVTGIRSRIFSRIQLFSF